MKMSGSGVAARRPVRHVVLSLLYGLTAVCAGCRGSQSPPPSDAASGTIVITGGEHLEWDQQASDATALSAIRYAIYVNGVRSELNGVTCAASSTSDGFQCRAPLPGLSRGDSTIELASFIEDGADLFESERSAPLVVSVRGLTTSSTDATHPAPWPAGARRVAGGLDRPTDLAFAPDGRLFVAEQSGHIRIVRGGALLNEPAVSLFAGTDGAGALLALAVDPQFTRTHHLFAIYASTSRTGRLTFVLARFREVSDTLGDRVILLDDVPAASDPHAALRFGPDAKLYAAFDAGGLDEGSAEDLASWNAKVLRLNPDGTTPVDQPRSSPVFAWGYRSPRGLGWHQPSGTLWVADADRLGAVPWAPPPSSIAVDGDALLVATEQGLQRVRFDPRNPSRLLAAETLLQEANVRAVAASPDGVYFVTDESIGSIARRQ
jgi:glucose/arabinose dehydrogenase